MTECGNTQSMQLHAASKAAGQFRLLFEIAHLTWRQGGYFFFII